MDNLTEFYLAIHRDLGHRYNLSSHQVNMIRSMVLGEHLDVSEVAEFCKDKLRKTKRQRSHCKAFYARILQFLSEATPLTFSDLLQRHGRHLNGRE